MYGVYQTLRNLTKDAPEYFQPKPDIHTRASEYMWRGAKKAKVFPGAKSKNRINFRGNNKNYKLDKRKKRVST